MAKTLTIKIEDRVYTLEYTRETVSAMERNGFSIESLSDKPMSSLPALFAGAFAAHHRIKREEIDRIFGKLRDKDGLFAKLVEMYNSTLDTLFDEPDEDEGNATWEATW